MDLGNGKGGIEPAKVLIDEAFDKGKNKLPIGLVSMDKDKGFALISCGANMRLPLNLNPF